MQIKQFNEKVFFASEQVLKIRRVDLDFLKNKSQENRRRSIRLCAHNNIEDELHEMFIVHSKDTYIRPHKRVNKEVSWHIIEGLADMVSFDEIGNIIEVIKMGDYSSGLPFYYRVNEPRYHSMIIRSDFLIFHETTKGPFKKGDTIFAPWAPEEADVEGRRQYTAKLLSNIAAQYGYAI